jgi:hypothetical protein
MNVKKTLLYKTQKGNTSYIFHGWGKFKGQK